jgi:integrase
MKRAKQPSLKGIKRVKRVRADGSIDVDLYHRATKIKLDPDNLVQSYAAADKKMRTKSTGTLTDLIRRFDTSTYFAELSDATREAYIWKLRKIEAKWGSCPIEAVVEDDFGRDALEWHDRMGKSSKRSADNLLAGLARVLSFAKENKIIKVNQLETFKRLYKNDRSEMVWSDALVARFLEVARPAMRTAMYLVRNIGQRQKDLRELPWSAYDGKTITLRTSKSRGKTPIEVPVTKELKTYLDGLPRAGVLILTTKEGRAFTKRYFNECWREDADLAGAGDLNFHDNRGTAATHLAEAGANAGMISSVMGWKTNERAQRIIDTYVAKSSALAAAGIELLEAHRTKKAAPAVTNGERA